MPVVHMLSWEESEAGWGCRPDGVSLHLTAAHAKAYLQAFYAARPPGLTPECYDRPASEEPVAVEVSEHLMQEVASAGGNFRAFDIVLRVSATGTRRAVRKGRYEGETFMDLVGRKEARIDEVDDFVARWHSLQAGDGAELSECLGLSSAEYAEFLLRPDVLVEIALARACKSLKVEVTRHLKSQGDYLVLGDAKLEGNLQSVCVYMGVDGQLWVRDAAEFRDGRFAPRADTHTPSLGLQFQKNV